MAGFKGKAKKQKVAKYGEVDSRYYVEGSCDSWWERWLPKSKLRMACVEISKIVSGMDNSTLSFKTKCSETRAKKYPHPFK